MLDVAIAVQHLGRKQRRQLGQRIDAKLLVPCEQSCGGHPPCRHC
jgi:hypothetical protein